MVKVRHFMDEADIGSGEKTPSQLEDMEQTAHLKEQQEQAKKEAAPQDGSRLYQVVEEQQYLFEQEGHASQPSEQLQHAERQMPNNEHEPALPGNDKKRETRQTKQPPQPPR